MEPCRPHHCFVNRTVLPFRIVLLPLLVCFDSPCPELTRPCRFTLHISLHRVYSKECVHATRQSSCSSSFSDRRWRIRVDGRYLQIAVLQLQLFRGSFEAASVAIERQNKSSGDQCDQHQDKLEPKHKRALAVGVVFSAAHWVVHGLRPKGLNPQQTNANRTQHAVNHCAAELLNEPTVLCSGVQIDNEHDQYPCNQQQCKVGEIKSELQQRQSEHDKQPNQHKHSQTQRHNQ